MTRVELAAIVVRDGTLFLVRDERGDWHLPHGDLPMGQDDIPREMRSILEAHGISTDAIEDDFVETHYTSSAEGPAVLNIYAPSNWSGEPRAPGGGEAGWFTVEEAISLQMEDQLRRAILQAFGLELAPDPAEEALATVLQFPSRGAVGEEEGGDETVDAADILSTLLNTDPEQAMDSLRSRYGEFAPDVVDAIDHAWTGPALDRKTRSMLVVSMVAAMGGRPAALQAHVNGALNHGATREEMLEVVRMVATYAGFPAAVEAWPVIDEALERRGMGRQR